MPTRLIVLNGSSNAPTEDVLCTAFSWRVFLLNREDKVNSFADSTQRIDGENVPQNMLPLEMHDINWNVW